MQKVPRHGRLEAKDIALTACFAALYAVLAFLPMFQIIGLFAKITAATIIAAIIGIVLGPYLGTLTTLLGGMIGLSLSPIFSLPSLVAGIITALCAGLLYNGRRIPCALVYVVFLLAFGLYSPVGPIWLYAPMMWLQIGGLLVLVSPLQSWACKSFNPSNASKLVYAFFITSLTSTLAGQIAGSLVFELTAWPLLIPDVNLWRTNWQVLTFIYPAERTAIAAFSVLIGVPLFRVLRSANLMPFSKNMKQKGKYS